VALQYPTTATYTGYVLLCREVPTSCDEERFPDSQPGLVPTKRREHFLVNAGLKGVWRASGQIESGVNAKRHDSGTGRKLMVTDIVFLLGGERTAAYQEDVPTSEIVDDNKRLQKLHETARRCQRLLAI
jgi:hypothetical protein